MQVIRAFSFALETLSSRVLCTGYSKLQLVAATARAGARYLKGKICGEKSVALSIEVICCWPSRAHSEAPNTSLSF